MCGLSLVEGMGATLAAARGLLIAASSLVAERGPWGTWASVVAAHGLACSTARGIFPAQGSNPRPLHWQADASSLDHQGRPLLNAFTQRIRTI